MTTPLQISRYDVLDLVRVTATFVGTDGVTAADPSTVMVYVKDPAGTVATYSFGQAGASITRAGVGAYYKDITVTTSGTWFYRVYATGGVQASEEYGFEVNRSFIL